MKPLLILTLSLFTFITIGCAGMADSMNKMAGIGVVTVENSTFDDAKIIKVTPTWLYEDTGSMDNIRTKLGARWTDKTPDYVALDLAYDSNTSGYSEIYLGFTGVDINIGGKITSFKTNNLTILKSSGYNTVSNTIYTKSENSVIIPMSLLEEMVSADDCRIRIYTSQGYEDAVFSIERSSGGQGTAILSIREFIATVKAES